MCWEEGRPRPFPPRGWELPPARFACPRPRGLQGKPGCQPPPCVSSGDDSGDKLSSVASCLPAAVIVSAQGLLGDPLQVPRPLWGPAWLLEMGVPTVLSAHDCIGFWGLSPRKCLRDCSDRSGTAGSGGGSCSELAAGSQHSGHRGLWVPVRPPPRLASLVSQKLPALGHIGRNIWPAASFFLPILPAKQPQRSQE